MMQWTAVIAFIFFLALVIFAVQNDGLVQLKFFTWQFETTVEILSLISFGLGAVMIGIFSLISKIKSRLKIHSLKGKIRLLEKDLDQLKGDKEQLDQQMKQMEIDLARYEGAEEVILTQEALEVGVTPLTEEIYSKETYSQEKSSKQFPNQEIED